MYEIGIEVSIQSDGSEKQSFRQKFEVQAVRDVGPRLDGALQVVSRQIAHHMGVTYVDDGAAPQQTVINSTVKILKH